MRTPETSSPYELLHDSINLTTLSPGSLVALWRNVHRELAYNERAAQEHGATQDFEVSDLSSRLDFAMDDLIRDNLPYARDVILAFVESPLTEDRENIITNMSLLSIEDHDFGLELWSRLAHDPSPAVRHAVIYELASELSRGSGMSEDDPTKLEGLGLTPEEAEQLVDAAERVARRELPSYDLGKTALAQVVGRADAVDLRPN